MKDYSSENIAKENCVSRNKKCKHLSDGKVGSPVKFFQSTTKDGDVTDKLNKRGDILDSAKNGSSGTLENSANLTGLSESKVKDNPTEKFNKICNILDSAKKEELDKESDECDKGPLSGLSTGLQTVNMCDSTKTCMNSEDASKKLSSKIRVYHHRRKNNSSAQNNDENVREDVVDLKVDMADSSKSDHSVCGDEKVSGDKGDIAISCNQSGIAATGNELIQVEAKKMDNVELQTSEDLQNALALLYRKRQELYHQICNMEDSLALYEDNIGRVRDGGEVGLARECIKSIISQNNNLVVEHGEDSSKSQLEKQTRLSETYLPGKSSCQDLEYICLKNNWRLPRYIIEPSDGKFVSDVIVQGKDFKLSAQGGFESKPCEARESAAAQMVAKIQNSCV